MTDLIYYKHDGRIHGPIAISKIRKLVQLGQSKPADQWSKDGMEWQSIHTLDGESRDNVSFPIHPEPVSFDSFQAVSQPQVPTPVLRKFPVMAMGLKQWAVIGTLFVVIIMGVLFLRNRPTANPVGEDNPDQGGQIPGAGVGGDNPVKEAVPFSAKELLLRHGKSVALVRRVTDTGGEVIGSGFLFKAGYLMTTAEVAGEDRGLLISVTFPEGNGDEKGPHQARIHHLDQDLAILRLDTSQGPIPFSSVAILKANEDLVLLASPGFSAPKTPMAVEATNANYVTTTIKKDLEYHRIGGKTKPAKVGAPVLDAKGTIVGMVASPIPANDPLCITSKQILKILKDVNLP